MKKNIASLCISLAFSVVGASAFASDEVSLKEGEFFFKCKVSDSTNCVIQGIPAYGPKEKAEDAQAKSRSPFGQPAKGTFDIPNFLANNLSLGGKGIGTLGEYVKDWRLANPGSKAVLTLNHEELLHMVDPTARVTRLTYANNSLFVHFVRGASK
jgi:hypothetical protein